MRKFDVSNYFIGSKARWKAVPAAWCRAVDTLPERHRFGNSWFVLNHESPSSWYYVREDGRCIVRISTHWSGCEGGSMKITRCGRVSSCWWTITRANKSHTRLGDVCGGLVFFEDMKEFMSLKKYEALRRAVEARRMNRGYEF